MEHTAEPIDRILVGIDFTEAAEVAFTQAINLSRKTGAGLFVVHAVAAREARRPGGSLDANPGGGDDRRAGTLARLEEMCRRGRDAGVDTHHRIVEAEPDEGIPKLAEALSAGLIVVGTPARSRLRDVFIGSVAERLSRLSQKRVLVARPRASARGGYNHILLPTDFSPSADEALAAAVAVVSAGGVIEVVHFWHMPLVAASYWVPGKIADSQRRMLRNEIDALGDELTSRFEARHPKISFDDEEKPAAAGILERIRSGVYDLVVMSSRGRRGLRRWASGSLAASTLRHAPCSVLVIRPSAP